MEHGGTGSFGEASSLIIRSAVAFYKEAAKLAPCAIVSGSPHDDVAAAAQLCGIADVTSFVLGAEARTAP